MMKKGPVNYLEVLKLESLLSKQLLGQEFINGRNLYKIVCIEKGEIVVSVDTKEYEISAYAMYFIAPNQITELRSYDSKTSGYCIQFDTDFFLLCLKNQVKLSFFPFFRMDQRPVLSLDESGWLGLYKLIIKLKSEHETQVSFNDEVLVKLYLNILLIEIERRYELDDIAAPELTLSRKHQITSRFRQLIEEKFMTLRKVSEYAEILAFTTNYLNEVVKETTGQSASELIHDRFLVEAKALLIQTELTVSQVAYELAFKDSSYFCRFFKKHTGESPQHFRKSHQL